ncbi:MAG TPA: methyltransferase domain-containing protein [Kofleriaceae bacterium]|jgi:predicted methyltransferase
MNRFAPFFVLAACATHSHKMDDPGRDDWQHPDDVVRALALTPAMTVADVGAGTGYFTRRLARAVPDGTVIAAELDPGRVKQLEALGLANVRVVQASRCASGLAPQSVDAILVVHVWHHLEDRACVARDLAAALRPGGKVVVVEYAVDAKDGPPQAMRLAPDTVVADLAGAGFAASVSAVALPDQYMVEARAPR